MSPLESVLTLDEEWFAEHPFSDRFRRPLTDAELAARGLPDNGAWWQLVVRVAPMTFHHYTYQKEADHG